MAMFEKVVGALKKYNAKTKENKKWYMDSYAYFDGDVGRVYDYQVADYTKKHLRLIDRFNLQKVVAAANWSFSILSKSCEEPHSEKKNWKYFKDV